MEFKAFSSGGDGGGLEPCTHCGRTFNPESLKKHERICERTQIKTRQVFNSGKQRAEGTGIKLNKIPRPDQPKQSGQSLGNDTAQGVKDTKWRQQHQDFINGMRSARAAQKAMATGGPLPPPPPPSINPNYIECPSCHRRFNRTAGERHIPFCADRLKTHGSPVKPLSKRAAADVRQSTSGIRKSYDNRVVRRKGNSNPYEFSKDFSSSNGTSQSANGSRGPAVNQESKQRAQSSSFPSRNNNSLSRQQSLPSRPPHHQQRYGNHGNNAPSSGPSQRNSSLQRSMSHHEQGNERPGRTQYAAHQNGGGSVVGNSRTQNGYHHNGDTSRTEHGRDNNHSQYDLNEESPRSDDDFVVRQNGTIIQQRKPQGSTSRNGGSSSAPNGISRVARGSTPLRSAMAGGGGGKGLAPVRSAVAGSRPLSRRPKSAVRFADQLERVEGQDLPIPHPPATPPPSVSQYQSAPPPSTPPSPSSVPARLQREQMQSPSLRASPSLSQESLSPRDDLPSPPSYQTAMHLRVGQRLSPVVGQRSSPAMGQRSSPSMNNDNGHIGGTPPGRSSTRPSLNPLNPSVPQVPTDILNGDTYKVPKGQINDDTYKVPSKRRGNNNNNKEPAIQCSMDKSAETSLPAPFCYDCGAQYPVTEARFCCGCGVKRAFISEVPPLT